LDENGGIEAEIAVDHVAELLRLPGSRGAFILQHINQFIGIWQYH